jgi:hypothetical protein
MAKKTKRPAANDWSDLPCENLLDVGFYPDDADSLPISASTWVAGAVYQTEPSAPLDGYFLPFANASDCLGWFRWWVLPACCLEEGEEFTPDEVELEGEFARVAEVIDNSEADQAEAILYYLAKHTEGATGGGVLPAEKDPFKSVVEGLLDVCPLNISYLIPLSDLLGRCGTDADAWENLLGVPVKFSGIRMVLPAKGWKKVKTLILDTLDGEDGSVDSLVNPLTAQLNPDSISDESM